MDIDIRGNDNIDIIAAAIGILGFSLLAGNLGWWDGGVFKAKRHKMIISVMTAANMIVLVVESINSQIII